MKRIEFIPGHGLVAIPTSAEFRRVMNGKDDQAKLRMASDVLAACDYHGVFARPRRRKGRKK